MNCDNLGLRFTALQALPIPESLEDVKALKPEDLQMLAPFVVSEHLQHPRMSRQEALYFPRLDLKLGSRCDYFNAQRPIFFS